VLFSSRLDLRDSRRAALSSCVEGIRLRICEELQPEIARFLCVVFPRRLRLVRMIPVSSVVCGGIWYVGWGIQQRLMV